MHLRRPVGPVVATLLVAGVVAGCGSAKAGPTVDPAFVSKQIRDDFTHRYSIPAPVVNCPSGESNTAGKTFSCSTTIDGQALDVNVQVSKPNDVHFQPAKPVVSTSQTEKAIVKQFAGQLGGQFTVSCGQQALRIVAVNGTFTCTGTVQGATRTFSVTVVDLASDVDLALEPPSTGPGSTTPAVTAPPTPGSTPGGGTLPGD